MVLSAAGTVVVTGASGFLGRALLPALADAGWRVRGLVRSLDATTAGNAAFFRVGDLASCSDADLHNAMRDADAVVHLAALAHRPLQRDDASLAALRRTNVDAAARVARAAASAGARTFIFASSVKVNGETSIPGRPLRESDPPHPADEYAQSKWQAERELAQVAEQSGMRVVVLRLPVCYGRGVKANVAALARAVRRGVPLPFASVANRRSILGVGNFADAVATILARADDVQAGHAATYFLADAQAVSTADLVRAMAKAMRTPARLWPMPPSLLRLAAAAAGRSETVERILDTLEVDTAAFRSAFDWSPPRSLEEGLAAALGEPPPL